MQRTGQIMISTTVLSAIFTSGNSLAECYLNPQLTGHTLNSGDYFGWSASMDGDVLIVGAVWDYSQPGDECTSPIEQCGAAHIYRKTGAETWEHKSALYTPDSAGSPRGDWFGTSVAVFGNVAVVGAHVDDPLRQGAAYVYECSNCPNLAGPENWEHVATLQDAVGGAPEDAFGYSVALGSTAGTSVADLIAVGAAYHDAAGIDAGAVYLYVKSGGTWNLTPTKITASDAGDEDTFGWAASVFGERVFVGAPHNDNASGEDAGAVYVYKRTGGVWELETKMVNPDAADGAGDEFGWSVSGTADRVAVGAYEDDQSAVLEDSGSAYVFHWNGSAWAQEGAKLTATVETAGELFGQSVSLQDSTLVVGASACSVGGKVLELNGAVYVFQRNGATWTSAGKLTSPDGTTKNEFGCAVATNGNDVAVGAPFGDATTPGSNTGFASAFDLTVNLTALACAQSADEGCSGSSTACGCRCGTCASGACVKRSVSYADVNCGGGAISLDDILCVLAGFSNLASCPNGNVAPRCAVNNAVDLDDLLAVLSAFGLPASCTCP